MSYCFLGSINLRFKPEFIVQEVIPTSLLKLTTENANRAVKMFLGIQKYMAEGPDALTPVLRYEMAQKLLHQVGLWVFFLPLLHEHASYPCIQSGHKSRPFIWL